MAEYTQTYWNELIDKYRNGTISESDRFQLEKQALDDPFLFDALEGFSLYEGGVKEKKQERKTVKIFTLSRIAVAASVVFLVAVMFNLNSNRGTLQESDNSMAVVLEENDEIAEKPQPKIEIGKEELATSTTAQVTKPSNDLPSKDEQPVAVIVQENSKDESNRPKQKESSPIEKKSTQTYAKVEDEGSDLLENETIESVELDEKSDGDMVSASDDAIVEHEEMNQAPKESIEIVGAANLEDAMKENKAEVVPADSGLNMIPSETGEKKRAKTSLFYKAVPVIGKEIFDDFAKEKIDERGLRQENPQEVTIEFTIDKNGNLSNFHHIFTGCSECGPFAISLLQKSGEWKTVPPGFSGKARYTFTF